MQEIELFEHKKLFIQEKSVIFLLSDFNDEQSEIRY